MLIMSAWSSYYFYFSVIIYWLIKPACIGRTREIKFICSYQYPLFFVAYKEGINYEDR
jgi:hypothetical protein